MGCDIHFFVEAWVVDRWVMVPQSTIKQFTAMRASLERVQHDDAAFDVVMEMHGWRTPSDGAGEHPLDSDNSFWRGAEFYGSRSYALFTALAGVRDYSDGRVQIISQPRGVAKDVSEHLRSMIDSWGDDGHSHSWLRLSELLHVRHTHEVLARDPEFQDALDDMLRVGDPNDVRAVFWFDN
jgi:hypothetical protein